MILKRFLIVVVFCLLAIASSLRAQTVYIAETGKKYHTKMCETAKGKKGIELSEAKKQGYTACSKCKPDQTKEATKPKKKVAVTKK